MLMMVWWNVWIYCNLNLCVAVVELGPKSSAVQTSHRFNYIQGGTLLQRFSIFGKNEQFNTFRSFSVYLGQPVSAINLNCCWISGELLKWNHWYKINLVTGHVVICDMSNKVRWRRLRPDVRLADPLLCYRMSQGGGWPTHHTTSNETFTFIV